MHSKHPSGTHRHTATAPSPPQPAANESRADRDDVRLPRLLRPNNIPPISSPTCLARGYGSRSLQGELFPIIIPDRQSCNFNPNRNRNHRSQARNCRRNRNRSKKEGKKTDRITHHRGILISIGGPAFVEYIRPTDEELRKRYNPDLQKRAAEQGSRREQEFDDYVTKLKEWSKSDKSSMLFSQSRSGCALALSCFAEC